MSLTQISTAGVKDDAVTAGKIPANAVGTSEIADDAVTADKLANSINSEITANTAKTTNATHTGEVTGGTALTIADNVVDEANLKVSNSPSNGYFLSAQSGNTGGLTWAEVDAGVNSDSNDNTVAGGSAGVSFDGNNAIHNTLFGKFAGTAITSGDYNTVFGSAALKSATGASGNIAIGWRSLEDCTGSYNTAAGYFAGGNITSGGFNTALGAGALDAQTTATHNTAVGYNALGSNTTGGNCVAFGSGALDAQTTATQNVGIGNNAGGAITTGGSNIAIGTSAMESLTTGNRNIAIGRTAMQNMAGTAHDNTAIGESAGYSINSGAYYNVYIGNYAGDSATTATHNTYVGYGSGTQSTTGTGNVYLGQTAAGSATTASSNVVIGASAGFDITTGSNLIAIGHAAGYNAGHDIVTGQFGIYLGAFCMAGATNSDYELVIGYNTRGKGSQTGFISPGGGGVYQGNNSSTWSTTSDVRIKKNIVNNNSGLDILDKIQVRNFEYKTEEEIKKDSPELKDVSGSAVVEKEGVQLGVIAQELEKILPEAVKTEESGVKSVNTDKLIWYLINSVKELSAEITALKAG